MCWQSKKTPVKMVAEEDIKVKKVLFLDNDNILHSPLRKKFMWDKNKLYTTELGEVERNTLNMLHCIHKGFHTANSIYTFNDFWTIVYMNSDYILFSKAKGEEIFDAIIPKGSEYYLNECGEYVSNKLMIL